MQSSKEKSVIETIPWYLVSGFGAHIKATPRILIVQKRGCTEEIPLSAIRHLLVMGGHTLHTSVVSRLLSAGCAVSFFEADGEPLGFLRPYGFQYDENVREAQVRAFPHSPALAIAKGSAHARILYLVRLQEDLDHPLFYEGELEVLEKSVSELDYLVRLEEVRRVHRLISDMYYEILARTIPADLGFRRRTSRPHTDVVNTLLSFGYGLLFGNMCVAVIGAHLDPEIGFLTRGKAGLVHDLCDPFRPAMIDDPVCSFVREGLLPGGFECGPDRCILSDELVHSLLQRLVRTIRQDIIDSHVLSLRESLMKKTDFIIHIPEPHSFNGTHDRKVSE
ncbi:MAG: CRISPR-associated endonuclease Cas1 [Methanolinea sp.]|jgi:CRISPR-associated endonuclease Cas1|nr:CRISPR-associated endonuclease Cas1 [Methanolinea sp.]